MGSFDKCNGLLPSQEPRRLRSRFIGIWKVRISFIVSFLSWTCCYRSTTHNANAKQLIFHHVPWKQRPKFIRTYPIQALHEHQAIFHVLELYSTNQIHICARPCITLCLRLISSGKSTTYYILIIWFFRERHAMVKTSLWSWNKKWVICIQSWSSEHLLWQARSVASTLPRAKFQRNLIKYFYVVRPLGKEYPLDTVRVKSPSEELIKISSVLQNFTNLTGS